MRLHPDLQRWQAASFLILLTTLGALTVFGSECQGQPRNLALDCSYALDPPPNYVASTDTADAQQLTDGHRVNSSRGWIKKSMVAWELSAGAQVSIALDLGRIGQLTEVVLSTRHAADSGILPPSVLVALSDDGENLRWAGAYDSSSFRDLTRDGSRKIELRIPLAQPATSRWVHLITMLQEDFLVLDEIEVFGAAASTNGTTTDHLGASTFQMDDSASFKREHAATQAARQRKLWSLRRHLPEGPEPQQQFPWVSLEEEEKLRFARRARAWQDTAPHRTESPLRVQRVAPFDLRNRWSPPGETRQDTLHVVTGNWSVLAFDLWATHADTAETTCRILPLPAGIRATLRKVESVESRNELWRDDALVRLHQPLSLLPGQSRQVWVDVDATQATPGKYRLRFAFNNALVDVPVRVYPRHEEIEPPLTTVNWTYPNRWEALREHPMAAIRDNLAAGINSWILDLGNVPWPDRSHVDAAGNIVGALDFSSSDRILQQYETDGPPRQLGWYWNFWIEYNDPSGGRLHHPYLSDPWKRAMEQWLGQWMQHLEQRGYATRYFMAPLDERGGDRVTQLFRYLKTAIPQLRLAQTLSRAQSKREIHDLLPWLDIAILGRDTLSYRQRFIDRMQAKGGEVWVYDVPSKTAHPEEGYRMLAWEAWARGLQGCGFWAYGNITGDSWDDFDGQYPDFSVVYNNPNDSGSDDETFVPSKRWRAFRMGMQDITMFAAMQSELPELREQVLQAVLDPGLRPAILLKVMSQLAE